MNPKGYFRTGKDEKGMTIIFYSPCPKMSMIYPIGEYCLKNKCYKEMMGEIKDTKE